jgi:hypothetical protein
MMHPLYMNHLAACKAGVGGLHLAAWRHNAAEGLSSDRSAVRSASFTWHVENILYVQLVQLVHVDTSAVHRN